MAPRADDAKPVWGIEAGNGRIRAARILRRPDGGFQILDFLEGEEEGAGAQALVAFLRKHNLTGHPIVVAIRDPATHMVSAPSTPEDDTLAQDELRSELMEHVHPEPEAIEFRFRREPSGNYLVSAEDRSRVESYIAALEAAETPAYALITSLDALLTLVRAEGHLGGDALVVHVQNHWTDLLFLDAGSIFHQGIPLGSDDLGAEDSRHRFRTDVRKILEYRRLQVSSGNKERVVLLGLDDAAADSLAEYLPERPIPFPASAVTVRGKGKMSPAATARVLRAAPAAVGAAIAGASSPRRLELAFHALPDSLPAPGGGPGLWFAAAAVLWLALGVFWFGANRGLPELREKKAHADRPGAAALDAEKTRELLGLCDLAERRLALPDALGKLFEEASKTGEGPILVDRIDLTWEDGGGYDVSLRFREDGK